MNPHNQNEELGCIVHDLLLRAKWSKLFTADELHALCYACGVQIDWVKETAVEKQFRQFREAEQASLRG